MADDILTASQNLGQSTAQPAGMPAEPAPEPALVVPPAGTAVPPAPPVMPSTPPVPPAPTPPPAPAVPAADSAALVENILSTPNPTPVAPPAHAPGNTKPLKKQSPKGMLIVLIALVLMTLPFAVTFINQRNSNEGDLRSRASGTAYASECTTTGGDTQGGARGTCPVGYVCHCLGGDACTGTKCEPDSFYHSCVVNQGRSWCENMHGLGGTCCVEGYVCNPSGNGCVPGTPPTHTPGGHNPTNTPSTNVGECSAVKIYKGGAAVTPSSLDPGDAVKLAVSGSNGPTKAHFRMNGVQLPGDTDTDPNWTETTTKNSAGEFVVNYTIPTTGVTDFVMEAEVFVDGVWK